MHTDNKMATERTFTMLFWLLVVVFTRLANFLVVEIDKLDVDASEFRTCCVVEMTWVNMPDSYKNRLDSDRFHGYFGMLTEQFDYVLGLVGPHILRLPTVYVAVYVQGRTTYERRFRLRLTKLQARLFVVVVSHLTLSCVIYLLF